MCVCVCVCVCACVRVFAVLLAFRLASPRLRRQASSRQPLRAPRIAPPHAALPPRFRSPAAPSSCSPQAAIEPGGPARRSRCLRLRAAGCRLAWAWAWAWAASGRWQLAVVHWQRWELGAGRWSHQWWVVASGGRGRWALGMGIVAELCIPGGGIGIGWFMVPCSMGMDSACGCGWAGGVCFAYCQLRDSVTSYQLPGYQRPEQISPPDSGMAGPCLPGPDPWPWF
jgi:hypothetical protein